MRMRTALRSTQDGSLGGLYGTCTCTAVRLRLSVVPNKQTASPSVPSPTTHTRLPSRTNSTRMHPFVCIPRVSARRLRRPFHAISGTASSRAAAAACMPHLSNPTSLPRLPAQLPTWACSLQTPQPRHASGASASCSLVTNAAKQSTCRAFFQVSLHALAKLASLERPPAFGVGIYPTLNKSLTLPAQSCAASVE